MSKFSYTPEEVDSLIITPPEAAPDNIGKSLDEALDQVKIEWEN